MTFVTRNRDASHREHERTAYPSYSPEGKYAVMAPPTVLFPPSPPPAPRAAVVFDGRTFTPVYRLPFAAASVMWVAQ